MGTLQADGFLESPYWTTEAPTPGRAPRGLPPVADVVVVGGGYCGVTAAAELAKTGRRVVLLEADVLGSGASTRNGGMVIPELKVGPAALERRYGELGTRLHHAVNEAFDWVEALIAGEPIDCDYERTGQLYLAHHPRLVDHLRYEADELNEAGVPARFVPRQDLQSEIGSQRYHAGIVLERTGGLQPARFHHGLVQRAERAGAELFERTPALKVERRHSEFCVRTERGSITAGQVVVATNAYADDLSRRLRRRVLPVGSYMIATEPVDPEVQASVNPNRRMFVDTKNFLFYWRVLGDGRMVFGGRRSLSPVSVSDAADFLYDSMVEVHPQLEGISITHAWGGHVAITLDRMPQIGTVDGLLYAAGCNGSGVALNTWLGAQLAAMADGAGVPPFAELTPPTIPLWSLRRAYLPLVGQWFRWRDRHP